MKVKDRKVLAFFLYDNQYNFSSLHCKFLVDTTLLEHITMHSQLCYEKNVSSDGNKSTNINKTYELEIQVLAWDGHNNVAELNLVNGIPTPLDNWISNGNICIQAKKKTCTDSLLHK